MVCPLLAKEANVVVLPASLLQRSRCEDCNRLLLSYRAHIRQGCQLAQTYQPHESVSPCRRLGWTCQNRYIYGVGYGVGQPLIQERVLCTASQDMNDMNRKSRQASAFLEDLPVA
jgi:hypothetical protein